MMSPFAGRTQHIVVRLASNGEMKWEMAVASRWMKDREKDRRAGYR
jgi:hypothetical protein